MKAIRPLLVGIFLGITTLFVLPSESTAQCAMCSLNAENSTQNGNSIGKGLNKGIYFLLSMPFLIGGGIGILWYTKFRKKEEKPSAL